MVSIYRIRNASWSLIKCALWHLWMRRDNSGGTAASELCLKEHWFPIWLVCLVQSITGMCEELSQVKIYPAVQTLAEEHKIAGWKFIAVKPINLKDEVNRVQKKCGIDNVPSLVRPLTPGLCIHKGAETFLNCFKREDSSEQHSCFHFSFLSALGCDIVFRDKLREDPPGHIIVWAAIHFWITPVGAAKPSGIELLCLPIELDVLQLW